MIGKLWITTTRSISYILVPESSSFTSSSIGTFWYQNQVHKLKHWYILVPESSLHAQASATFRNQNQVASAVHFGTKIKFTCSSIKGIELYIPPYHSLVYLLEITWKEARISLFLEHQRVGDLALLPGVSLWTMHKRKKRPKGWKGVNVRLQLPGVPETSLKAAEQ